MYKLNSASHLIVASIVLVLLTFAMALQSQAAPSITPHSPSNGVVSMPVGAGQQTVAANLPLVGQWTQGSSIDMPHARYAAASDGTNFYVISGRSQPGHSGLTSEVGKYNPAVNQWSYVQPIPTPVVNATGVYTNGRAYVVGGYPTGSGAPISATQIFTNSAGVGRWGIGTNAITQTADAAAGVWGNKIYVAGGISSTNELQIYDVASNSWTIGSPSPNPIINSGYVVVGSDLYVVGGYIDPTSYENATGRDNPRRPDITYSSATMRLDMATGLWYTATGPGLINPRANFALAWDGANNIYAIGGNTSTSTFTSTTYEVDVLDLSTWPNDSWVPSQPLPHPAQGNTAGFNSSVHGGEIWSIGGVDVEQNGTTYYNDAWYLPLSSPPTPTIGPTQPPGSCPSYTDVCTDYWAYGYIESLSSRGIVSGYPDNSFHPNAPITRAELTKISLLGFGITINTPTSATFTDVPSSNWAYNYIGTASSAGYINGFDAATCAAHGAQYPCYLPNQPVSRAEMVKILVNASGKTLVTPPQPYYTDVPTSHWAYNSIETATYYQWVSGYPGGLFLPNADSTRAEMSKVLYLAIAPQAKPGK